MLGFTALLAVASGFSVHGQNSIPEPGAAPQVNPGGNPGRGQETPPGTNPRAGGRFGQPSGSVNQFPPGGFPAQPPEVQPGARPSRFGRGEALGETGTATRDLPPLRHPRDKTLLVEIKQAKPDVLAKSLQKTMGDTMTIEVAAGTPVPAILISGTEKGVQEIREIITKLDLPAKTETLEFTVLESASDADLAAQIQKESEGGDNKFSNEGWQKTLKSLQAQGMVSSTRVLELKASENQPARIQVGEDKPFATGSMMSARGIANRSFSYRPVGSMATVTLRQPKEGEFKADIRFEESRISQPKAATAPDKDQAKDKEKDKEKETEEFKPDSIINFSAETTANLIPGKAVAINSNQEWDKSGNKKVMVFVRLKTK